MLPDAELPPMEEKADTRVTTNTHGGPRRHTGGHPDTRGTHGGTAARNGGAPNKMVVAETAAATAAATADKMVPEMVVPIFLRVVPGLSAQFVKRVFQSKHVVPNFVGAESWCPKKNGAPFWAPFGTSFWAPLGHLVLGTVGAPRVGHRVSPPHGAPHGRRAGAPRVPAARATQRC